MLAQFWWGNLKETARSKNLGIDDRIILKKLNLK
jgi:hypothetical protein